MDGEYSFNSLAAWLRATVLVLPLLVGCQGDPPPSAPAVKDKPTAQDDKLTKVILTANGDITANGKSVTLDQLKARFKRIQAASGEVWYYRNENEDEHPNAMKLVMLAGETKVMMKRSHQPDFSDLGEGKEKKLEPEKK